MSTSAQQNSGMRIAFVHSFYSSRQPSGENFVVQAEVNALRKAGYEVELFAAHTDQLEGDRLYPVRAALRVASGRGRSPLKAIKNWGPDIVHIHNLFPNFGRRWVEDVDVPIVHTLHNYRPLCANGLLFRDGEICTRCPDGDRWAGTRYGCYRDSRLATLPITWANRGGPMGDPLLRRADRLIALSDPQRHLYVDAGVPDDKIVVIPNFLPDELDPGPEVSEGGDSWLFVGRLSEEKGILRLIEHWPQGHKLVVVGDGPLRRRVENLAYGKPIHVMGAMARGDLMDLMSQSLGLVFPSIWLEVAPLVYLESIASGLPVLAFEPTAVAQLVVTDRTGWSIRWEDDLHSALSRAREEKWPPRAECRKALEARYQEWLFLERIVGHGIYLPTTTTSANTTVNSVAQDKNAPS